MAQKTTAVFACAWRGVAKLFYGRSLLWRKQEHRFGGGFQGSNVLFMFEQEIQEVVARAIAKA